MPCASARTLSHHGLNSIISDLASLEVFIKDGIMAANLRKLAASKSLALLRRITNEGEADEP